jgi:hypothetical protein
LSLYRNSKNLNLAMFFIPFVTLAFSLLALTTFEGSSYLSLAGLFVFLGWMLLVVSKWPQMVDDKIKFGIAGHSPVRKQIYFLSYLLIGIGILLALFSLFETKN